MNSFVILRVLRGSRFFFFSGEELDHKKADPEIPDRPFFLFFLRQLPNTICSSVRDFPEAEFD